MGVENLRSMQALIAGTIESCIQLATASPGDRRELVKDTGSIDALLGSLVFAQLAQKSCVRLYFTESGSVVTRKRSTRARFIVETQCRVLGVPFEAVRLDEPDLSPTERAKRQAEMRQVAPEPLSIPQVHVRCAEGVWHYVADMEELEVMNDFGMLTPWLVGIETERPTTSLTEQP